MFPRGGGGWLSVITFALVVAALSRVSARHRRSWCKIAGRQREIGAGVAHPAIAPIFSEGMMGMHGGSHDDWLPYRLLEEPYSGRKANELPTIGAERTVSALNELIVCSPSIYEQEQIVLGKCGVLAKSIEKHFFKKSTNDPMVSRNRDAAIGAITSLEAAVKAAPESEEAKILHITHE